jgi:hypothetical protein
MDLVMFLVSLVATGVVCGALFVARRSMQGQGWKDFLGMTMAFFVLVEATAMMIIGEHALG